MLLETAMKIRFQVQMKMQIYKYYLVKILLLMQF